MNQPKKHHYVQRAYLDGWGDTSGKIYICDLTNGNIYKGPAKSVAWKKYYYFFYDPKHPELDPQIEQLLSQDVEGPAFPLIKKLSKGQFLNPLEKNQLSWYVAFQKVRVPFFEKSSNQLSEKLDKEKILKILNDKTEFNKFIKDQKKKYKGQEKIPTRKELIDTIKTNRISMKYPRAHSLRIMMFLAVPLSDLYTDSQWILLQARDSAYITSDNPAVTMSMAKNGKIPFSETTFPLTPQSCLMINQEQHGKTFITEEKTSGVKEINRRTLLHATRFLFGNDKTLLKQYYKEYLKLKILYNTIQSNIGKSQPLISQRKLFIRRVYKH